MHFIARRAMNQLCETQSAYFFPAAGCASSSARNSAAGWQELRTDGGAFTDSQVAEGTHPAFLLREQGETRVE